MPKIASGIRVSKAAAGQARTVNRSAKTGRFVVSKAAAGQARTVNRSAGSGRFVSKAAAARSPGKTITERVGRGTSSGRVVVQTATIAVRERPRREPRSPATGAPSLPSGPHAEPSVDRARRLRHLRDIARLDYLRELRRLSGSLTQVELARSLGVSQPAVSDSMKTAARVPEPRAGFSGADPYEIAQRYAAGDLSRDQLIDELARWEYRPHDPGDGYDWLTYEPGEWDETVGRALDDGLLDEETYTAIQHRVRGLRAAG